jgi:hypothetical protein
LPTTHTRNPKNSQHTILLLEVCIFRGKCPQCSNTWIISVPFPPPNPQLWTVMWSSCVLQCMPMCCVWLASVYIAWSVLGLLRYTERINGHSSRTWCHQVWADCTTCVSRENLAVGARLVALGLCVLRRHSRVCALLVAQVVCWGLLSAGCKDRGVSTQCISGIPRSKLGMG